MSFDWASYFGVCDFLNDNYHCEASFRSSVSRAYYGAFGRAKLFCIKMKYIKHNEGGPGIHQKVIEVLTSVDDDPEIYRMGHMLGSLRDNRNKADYDVHHPGIDAKFANNALINAREIIQIIADYD